MIVGSTTRLEIDFMGFSGGASLLAEDFGSGDGEREASMTGQMPYEPLPASVFLSALFWV